MNRKATVVLAVAGAAAAVVSFLLPPDFAWNGLNAFNSCISTSQYASGYGARAAWFGFAVALLYPYVWAVAAGTAVAMEWRGASPVAPLLPSAVTAIGCALTATLGVLLLSMREAWPSPPVQWTAVIASSAHAGILWIAIRRVQPARCTAVAVIIGGIPFVFLQLALAKISWRYGSPVSGFALAAAGDLAIIVAACLHIACTHGNTSTASRMASTFAGGTSVKTAP